VDELRPICGLPPVPSEIPFSGFHQCNALLHCAQHLPQYQFARKVAINASLPSLPADHPAAFNAELFEAIPAIRSFQDFVNELAP
jgi:hypothetical protein